MAELSDKPTNQSPVVFGVRLSRELLEDLLSQPGDLYLTFDGSLKTEMREMPGVHNGITL